ncbi:tannase and feruloyl esterase [Pyronema omphalodes]|nr:tannase and feruloyl esterase [Pyronema omphalodes]
MDFLQLSNITFAMVNPIRLLPFLPLALGASNAKPTADHCVSFGASLNLPNTKVLHTTHLSGNQTFSLPGADPTCDQSTTAAASLCRLSLLVNTTTSSQVQMELWLPDDWSGRTSVVGNGGLNGCIDYANLNYLSSYNFAVVGSNNGHNGTGGAPFLNAPEVITDFAWRAIHTESDMVKEIVKRYYGRKQTKAYYVGCSTGGRQGFKSAQDFPGDFDGILAGAPAFDFNHLLGWSGILSRYNGAPGGKPIIGKELLAAVGRDVISQCDLIDGVKDGIIDHPDQCIYRPEAMLCSESKKDLCLTPQQAEIIRRIFEPIYGMDGKLLYPRYEPGADFGGYATMTFSGNLFQFALDWAKYVIYNDTSYTGSDFGLQTIAAADALNPGNISTWKQDLSAFAKRGGKVISYHGRADPLIPSGNSARYYDGVVRTMGQSKVSQFYRLFMAPGMDHCGGGVGADRFGQIGRQQTGIPKDKEHNILLALVDWVENGKAPEQIIGTNIVNGTVEAQRVHCPYPEKSVLKEGGDWRKAESWECVP